MIVCKELNQSFVDKKELFRALKANKAEILAQKRADIIKTCDKDISVKGRFLDAEKLSETIKEFDTDDNYYYLAVNSTRILDSHNDLHLDGIWNKTVREQQGKNYLVLDHEVKVLNTVVRKEHIEMFTATVPFSVIGKSYGGDTEILVYKFPKEKLKNDFVKEWLDSGDAIEASVRMQYVKISLAMDSDSKDDIEEKKEYDKYIDLIANKGDYDKIDYFFPIYEAKNITESSLVPFGSNSSTGLMQYEKKPSNDTSKQEAEQSLQDDKREYLINSKKQRQ